MGDFLAPILCLESLQQFAVERLREHHAPMIVAIDRLGLRFEIGRVLL
jgi:hypothetical protein